MKQDNDTEANDSPKQGGFLSKLRAFAEAHPWVIVAGSAKQISRKDLNRVNRIDVNYSKKYKHLYATVYLKDGYVNWQLDKNFKGEEGDEIDPSTFMVYKLTNGYSTIERCNGKPLTPQMKNINIFKDNSIGIYINEDTLQIPELELIPVIRGHRIGFIDSQAKVIIEPVYDNFKGKFLDKHDYICVKQGNKWGVVNSEGKILLKIEYNYIVQGIIDYDLEPWKRDYMFTVCKEKQYAVFNNYSEVLVDFGTYDWISGFDSRLAIVRKGNKYGMIDYSGTLVLPVEYNSIEEFYNKGKTSTKAYKLGNVEDIDFLDLVCYPESEDEDNSYNEDYCSSAYSNPYYNDSLDFDQQSEDFWESL